MFCNIFWGGRSKEDIVEITKDYWNCAHFTLPFVKRIINGIGFKNYPPTFGIDKVEIPQCVWKGAILEFLEWTASEKHACDIAQIKNEEYKPDDLLVKCFVEKKTRQACVCMLNAFPSFIRGKVQFYLQVDFKIAYCFGKG